MKKLLGLATIIMAVMLLAGCSDNSPKGVAAKALDCIIDKDFAGYADLLYLKADGKEDIDTQKKAISSMLEDKYDKSLGTKGGLKSYEILGEEVDEDGKKAVVNVKLVYGNGEEKDGETIELRKDDSGNWKIDNGK